MGIAALFLLMLAGNCMAQGSETGSQEMRVGIYDSRIVAIAFARSAEFQGIITKVREDFAAAEKKGDKELMSAIGNQMRAQQDQFHRQAFSIWPVRDILSRVRKKLPDIAQGTGAQILLCKWDIDYKTDGLSFIDVSMEIAKLFKPDEETMKILSEVGDKAPVPLNQLKLPSQQKAAPATNE